MSLLSYSTLAARWLAVAGLGLLALLAAPVCAQTIPPPAFRFGSWPPTPTPLIYIDAQLADSAALASLLPATIASLNVVQGKAARALNSAATGRGILVFTTQAQENNAAVRAFERRVAQVQQDYEPASYAAIQVENDYPPAGVRYYLNGSLATINSLRSLDNHIVRTVRTLHGRRATDFAHDTSVDEVFLITTQP